MFNNDIFIPHVYTTLEAEFQVMKKEANPVKYTVFLLFCYIYIYKKKMSWTMTFLAPLLSEEDPY